MQSHQSLVHVFILLSLCSAGGCADSYAAREAKHADIPVHNGQRGEMIRVGLTSWRDLPFKTVKRQALDFSCGSAAVATLMTYIYEEPVSEKDVFREMFLRGDQNKIRQEGFSMLDMSDYLNAHGLEAKGYRIGAEEIDDYRLPFIALINTKGYNHFVVVKNVDTGRVLVGDPNKGNLVLSRDDFLSIWNGLALVVVNQASKGRAAFNSKKEWRYARAAAPVEGNAIGNQAAGLSPMAWQIFPKTGDIMPATMMGLVATNNWGGS